MLSKYSAIIIFLAELNLATIEAAVDMMAKGQDPYSLHGVAEIEEEAKSRLPDLTGCAPSLVDGSTRDYVQVAFQCESKERAYQHIVSFYHNEANELSIHFNPIPSALGPTKSALESENMPSKTGQFRRLIRAVRKSEDLSFGGLMPLTETQIEELKKFGECDWRSPRKLESASRTWFSIVHCDFHEPSKAQMIEIEFDKKDRALAIHINDVTAVKRDQ